MTFENNSQSSISELEKFIRENVQNNFPGISNKKATLAKIVTSTINKAMKTKEDAIQSRSFVENEVLDSIKNIKDAIGNLKQFSEMCIKIYSEKMQIDVKEEYSLYFTKYSDKATKAIKEMESLLQHSKQHKSTLGPLGGTPTAHPLGGTPTEAHTLGGDKPLATPHSNSGHQHNRQESGTAQEFAKVPGMDPSITEWRPAAPHRRQEGNMEVGTMAMIMAQQFDINQFIGLKFSGLSFFFVYNLQTKKWLK